jgi:hypothetical protein
MENYRIFHIDELLDKEHPKYMSLIHKASGSDGELTVKVILGFENQCPEHITLMKVPIGNFEGFHAVIVKMSNLVKLYTLNRELQIDAGWMFRLVIVVR